jgi:signal peptidase I
VKIGDLVKYNDPRYPEWSSLIGIIANQIPGAAEYQRVIWNNGTHSTLPKKYLRRINYEDSKRNFTKKQER